MATKVTRNNASSGSRRTMTWSWWIKKTKNGATQYLFNQYRSSDQYNSGILFQNDDKFRFWDYGGSSNDINIITNRMFRDINAWYHIVLAIDTTQATSSNRVKLYVNGVQETSFSTETYPNQNHDVRMNEAGSASQQQIGFQGYGSTFQSYFLGVMSHVNFVDAAQLTPSSFGSTDSTTGEWKINTSPSVTYGQNGFFIFKDGNSVVDQSGNSANFTVGAGSLTKTEDCPSNVFATMNPIAPNDANGNFTHGNTSNNTGASAWRTMYSTMGDNQGKYYCEMKYVSGSNQMFGIFSLDEKNKIKNVGYIGDNNLGNRAVGIAKPGNYYINGSAADYPGGSNTSWTTGDIIMIAMDRTNKKVIFGKNGTWMGSGDPTSGSTGTGAISFQTEDFESWGFATSCYASTSATNFGNGYFQTTAISSAGTNASNLGLFEYNVPAGYTALCTKGLNE